MSWNNNNGQGSSRQRVTQDKWGNPQILRRLTQKVDKKSGEVLPIYAGYIEIGNQLYSVEVSNCNKESKTGLSQKWLKVTKKVKRTNNVSF